MEKLFVRDDIGICDRCIETCRLVLAEPRKLGAKEYDSWIRLFDIHGSHDG